MTDDFYNVPREDVDSTWCVYCCHSHPSGERCGAPYMYVEGIGHDECGCDADHHPDILLQPKEVTMPDMEG